ncbi:MAG: DUF4154 domain-containing protein [Epsilonproteobacteria bacterium]|nr:DUF4154 domain-containing protein [Campylobacterota bacterium]
MRILFLLFFIVTFGFAVSINDSLLKIHAILLPKIYLMDNNYQEKITNNTIKITILYDANDYRNALTLEERIQKRYHNKIKGYMIKTVLLPYEQVASSNANIYYLFPTNIKNIKQTVKRAKQIKALTFAYLNHDLKNGIVLSLEISQKVKPIINLSAAKATDISFKSVLLKISDIYVSEKIDIQGSKL